MPATITGLDNLIKELDSKEKIRAAVRGLKAAALHVKGKIDDYPQSTIANSPSNPDGRWYERGFGPRWKRRDGSIGGSRTSEALGRKWTVKSENQGLTQVVGNNVTYAPPVHSAEQQASFHGARGWKTDEQVAEEESRRVVEFIKSEIVKEMAR